MTLKKPQDFFHREKKITTFNKPIEKLVETPEMRSFSNAFDSYKDNINKFNALSDTVKGIESELENYINKEELDHAMVACSFLVNESIEELREKIETETQKSVYNLKKNVNDISESINLFITDEAPKLKKAVSTSELRFEGKIKDFKDEVCLDIEETLKETISKNQSYLNKQNKNFENIKNDILSLSEELNLDEIKNKKDSLDKKINYLENLITDFKKEKKKVLSEGLLNEPPSTKNQDPLTPLDQKFVTFDQLSEHYQLFINRIQQQISTLGGGGETRLEFLDDIDRSTALVNNRVLKYDAASKKFVGTTAAGGQSLDEVLDIGNTTNKGIVVGVVTASQFSGNITGNASINVTGIITAQRIFSSVHGEFTGGSVLASSIVGTALSISGISTLGVVNATSLDVSGNIGIGSQNPQAKLDVRGDINFQNSMLISNDGGINNIDHIWHGDTPHDYGTNGTWNFVSDGTAKQVGNSAIQIGFLKSSGGGYFIGDVGIGTTNPQAKLDVDGTVTATDFNSTSDVKLKKNIKQIEDPMSKIMTIEGVSFNWKSDNRPSLGVIADDLKNTLPELVSGDDPKTVNYNGLVGLLIECVKNQQQQIDELKDQLNN